MVNRQSLKIRALCEGALMVAAAQVLGFLKLYSLPTGGSVTLGMLPVFLYCARWGVGPGLMVSFAYSLLQLLLDGAYAWGWESIVGDYLLAYTVLAVAGLFHKRRYGFFAGILTGGLARLAVAWVTGATVWGKYMPDTFFGMSMTSPWFYSILYNSSYLLPSLALCAAVGLLLWKPIGRLIRGEDLPESRERIKHEHQKERGV